MNFTLLFTQQASDDLDALEQHKSLLKRLKAVRKTLGYLEVNPRHPNLRTHKYTSIIGPQHEEVFEAYAENNTPAAYRIFWYYGPQKNEITIITITKHP